MDYLIVDGNPDPNAKIWENYLTRFERGLAAAGSRVTRFTLRDLDVKPCTGCFKCWHTTPGRCRFRDDMEKLYPAVLGTDVTVWASPLILGYVSSLTKLAQDRIIPLLHPFFAIVKGECHHRRRYPKRIHMGLVVEKKPGDGDEDVEVVRHMHERFALNGHGRLRFAVTTDTPAARAAEQAEEAMHETITA